MQSIACTECGKEPGTTFGCRVCFNKLTEDLALSMGRDLHNFNRLKMLTEFYRLADNEICPVPNEIITKSFCMEQGNCLRCHLVNTRFDNENDADVLDSLREYVFEIFEWKEPAEKRKLYGVGQTGKGRVIHLSHTIEKSGCIREPLCNGTNGIRVVGTITPYEIEQSVLYNFICYECMRAFHKENEGA